MRTTWHPYTEPPEPMKYVRLRFGDDGQRDCNGFYSQIFGGYYRGESVMRHGCAVHPTHWAEIEETQQ